MIHINLWIILLWGLLDASLCNQCLLASALCCSAWLGVHRFCLYALDLTENWGLATLWSGKGLAAGVMDPFWNVGDHRFHWDSPSKEAASSLGTAEKKSTVGQIPGPRPRVKEWVDWSLRPPCFLNNWRLGRLFSDLLSKQRCLWSLVKGWLVALKELL